MWLLRADLLVNSGWLQLEEVDSDEPPIYAILSHTWGDGEVLFKDIHGPGGIERARKITNRHISGKTGHAKVLGACKESLKREIRYVWIDTCCINKDSSAELSEAINSMYRWYERAECCFAYLSDYVRSNHRPQERSDFSYSRWFGRGWTLQELLAPRFVYFFDADWTFLGEKREISDDITWATGIDARVLDKSVEPSRVSVAKRMHWISNRRTTRKEDLAYCMLGIFGVNMALLYGEGDRAFLRLQEEILRASDDLSIFAWTTPFVPASHGSDWHGMLAENPRDVAWQHQVATVRDWGEPSAADMTSSGLSIRLPLSHLHGGIFLARLNCKRIGHEAPAVAVFLLRIPGTVDRYARVRVGELWENHHTHFQTKQIYVLQSSFRRPQLGDFNVISSFRIQIKPLSPRDPAKPMTVRYRGCLDRTLGERIRYVEPSELSRQRFEMGDKQRVVCILIFSQSLPQRFKLGGGRLDVVWGYVLIGTITLFGSLVWQSGLWPPLSNLDEKGLYSDRDAIFHSITTAYDHTKVNRLGESPREAEGSLDLFPGVALSVDLGPDIEDAAQNIAIEVGGLEPYT